MERAYEHNHQRHAHQNLLNELRKDGLIDSSNEYSIRLNAKKFKVNGKKVDSELHQKYLDLIGQDANNNINIHLEKH